MVILIIFLIIMLSSLILMTVYILKRFNNLSIIKKLLNKIPNRIILHLVKLIPILVLLIFMYIDMINTVIIYIHIFVFLLISDLVLFIIKKISKKKLNYSISFIIAILLTTIYLGHGYYLAHHVVKTNYLVNTTKNIGEDNFRIIQISDSHLGTTMDGDDFENYMKKVNKTNPDIVVITGDFVDDDTSYEDMIKGCNALGNLKTKYGVYFVYGNHDKGYYNNRNYNDEDIRKELRKNNVKILEDEAIEILDNIVLVGRQDAQISDRASMKSLAKNLDKDKYIITLDHQPNDYNAEAKENIDLVLSGHTHGGQLFPIGQMSVLLGINDKYYGLEQRNKTTFIVSSGIGNWAIKFKTATIAEYVVIDIKNKSN